MSCTDAEPVLATMQVLSDTRISDSRLLRPAVAGFPVTQARIGSYTLRVLQRSDAAAALDLYRLAGEWVPPHACWNWRFFGRNQELTFVLGAFTGGGDLVGLYPGTIRPVRVAGQDCLTYQACHTLIHPAHRGGGRIFLALMRFVKMRAQSLGIHFGYGGGANEAVLKFGEWTMGIHELLALRTRERRLSLRMALGSRVGRVGERAAQILDPVLDRAFGYVHADVEVEVATEAGAEFERLWERLRDRRPVTIRRDAVEVHWRWLECPIPSTVLVARRGGELQGYAAIRHHDDDLGEARLTTILDLFTAEDPAIAEALISAAGAEGVKEGTDFLHHAPFPGSEAERVLEGRHWRDARRPRDRVIIGRTSDNAAAAGVEAVVETALDGRNWHYCQGDSDFFD